MGHTRQVDAKMGAGPFDEVGASVHESVFHRHQFLAKAVEDTVVDEAVGTPTMVEHHVDVVGSHTHLDGGTAARRERGGAVDITRKTLETEVGTAFPTPVAGAFHHDGEGAVVVGGVVGLHHKDRNALSVLRKGDGGLTLITCGVFIG